MSSYPSILRKLRQLWSVVRESHRRPIAGQSVAPTLVDPDDLGITFIGHSSFLVAIGNRHILIDPVFAKRLILLRRQRRPGLQLNALPPIDAVLLTHAHMDHLNLASLRRIIRHTRRISGHAPHVIVPRGVADLVAKLGFRSVTELTWWQTAILPGPEAAENAPVQTLGTTDGEDPTNGNGVAVTMTPAQHWGARMFSDTHRHFGGYVLQTSSLSGTRHAVYHSGDTAYFPGFREIGRRLQPQVALLPIGAYYPDSYRAVHTSPEEAVQAYLDLGTATTLIPMHFGTFPLGREPMTEPPVRLQAAAARAGISSQLHILTEGQLFVQHSTPATSARGATLYQPRPKA